MLRKVNVTDKVSKILEAIETTFKNKQIVGYKESDEIKNNLKNDINNLVEDQNIDTHIGEVETRIKDILNEEKGAEPQEVQPNSAENQKVQANSAENQKVQAKSAKNQKVQAKSAKNQEELKNKLAAEISEQNKNQSQRGSNCFSYSYSTLRINKNERKRK